MSLETCLNPHPSAKSATPSTTTPKNRLLQHLTQKRGDLCQVPLLLTFSPPPPPPPPLKPGSRREGA